MQKLTSILFLFLITTSSTSFSQEFSKDYWHLGELDMASGETLNGKIKYNLEENHIQLQTQKRILTFSTHKLEAFQIMDVLEGYPRYFFVLPLADESGYEKRLFFELLTEGKISLLSRERVVERVQTHYDPFWIGGRNFRVTILEDNFFLMNEEGILKPCDANLESLIRFFPEEEDNLREFVKSHKLQLEFREDMIRVIDYYNSLQSQ